MKKNEDNNIPTSATLKQKSQIRSEKTLSLPDISAKQRNSIHKSISLNIKFNKK